MLHDVESLVAFSRQRVKMPPVTRKIASKHQHDSSSEHDLAKAVLLKSAEAAGMNVGLIMK